MASETDLVVIHEHPEWQKPLFAALENRGIAYAPFDLKHAAFSNVESLRGLMEHPRHVFVQADICDAAAMARVLTEHRPDAVMNLAAESHVDRSIDGPGAFIQTNVMGVFTLLETSRKYWGELRGERRDAFRFLHVSTDEVFGSLGATGRFDEQSRYQPNSPYSASKAAVHNLSKNLAREWAPKRVRVNTIVPGFFPAEQNRKILSPERVASILGHTPMKRFGEARELIGATLLLASDAAGGFITGSEIVVDGGYHAMTI